MALHRVAPFADVPENRGLEARIADTNIVLLRVGDQLRAYQGECPHAGAPLAEGAVCHGRLICPWHKAEFRIEDGALCEPPALDSLKRYPLEVRDGDIWVDDQPLPMLTPRRLTMNGRLSSSVPGPPVQRVRQRYAKRASAAKFC